MKTVSPDLHFQLALTLAFILMYEVLSCVHACVRVTPCGRGCVCHLHGCENACSIVNSWHHVCMHAHLCCDCTKGQAYGCDTEGVHACTSHHHVCVWNYALSCVCARIHTQFNTSLFGAVKEQCLGGGLSHALTIQLSSHAITVHYSREL